MDSSIGTMVGGLDVGRGLVGRGGSAFKEAVSQRATDSRVEECEQKGWVPACSRTSSKRIIGRSWTLMPGMLALPWGMGRANRLRRGKSLPRTLLVTRRPKIG